MFSALTATCDEDISLIKLGRELYPPGAQALAQDTLCRAKPSDHHDTLILNLIPSRLLTLDRVHFSLTLLYDGVDLVYF